MDLETHSFDRTDNVITVCITLLFLGLIIVKGHLQNMENGRHL